VSVKNSDGDLGLRRIRNGSGLSVDVLPNGCLFAIEHGVGGEAVMVNQVLGSPLTGGIGRLLLRIVDMGRDGGRAVEMVGPGSCARVGTGTDRFVWEGEAEGVAYRVTLWVAPEDNLWLWRVEVESHAATSVKVEAVLVQDVGLAVRGFLMNNEAYASQYIDHHIARHSQFGHVVMSRQGLAQGGRHPWVAHGCFDGASRFATDAAQIFGPGFRDQSEITADLPSERLQHEVACPAIGSEPRWLVPSGTVAWTFFGLFFPDHPEASGPSDLARIDVAAAAAAEFRPKLVGLTEPVQSLVQTAPPLAADDLDDEMIARLWPERRHEERAVGATGAQRLLSWFTPAASAPAGAQTVHVVLRDKERRVRRGHGVLLRSGRSMLPDDDALCATVWARGVFAAQLTIGNSNFHKLFSVSRDPYNITRGSGLRILVDGGQGWHLLAVPSAFEMGLAECRWVYGWGRRVIAVRAAVAGEDAAMQWQVTVDGEGSSPCRFLVFGHLVLGERELEQRGRVEIDAEARRMTLRPDPDSRWGRRYPDAVFHLVTATPEAVEAMGGDALLYADGKGRGGAYIALRTGPVASFSFAVTGSLTDPEAAAALAARYARGVPLDDMLAPAAAHWTEVTRDLRILGDGPDAAVLDTIFPWLAHDAMMHLTVPHGLEQYSGAAWGTRDVCQGPVEFLLALEHDAAVKEILRIVFAQQYEERGDWPQWFMLEPYSLIQDTHAHGDVIVWPLKALCDYVEATGDVGFLGEPVAWRRHGDFERTERTDPVAAHVATLVATVRGRFIPGTHLLRYGEGDWNDSLQPVDPRLRDWMVSAWTVTLLIQQLGRTAAILRHAERGEAAQEMETLAAAMRGDLRRFLIRDGVLAGYAVFAPEGGEPELLLHPSDTRTGLRYSLLPMKQALIAGLFDGAEAQRHLQLIRDHLVFPDGARLMDRPVAYHGGTERLFRRAEAAAFFGREIGLMYTHAHLRYGEAMAAQGEADALWRALLVANPIAVSEMLAHAAPRQRNTYFSSSDAAFPDRYAASAEWERVKTGTIAVEGGWRIYSSGPGLYTNLLLRHALGLRRRFGTRIFQPLLPREQAGLALEMTLDGERKRWASARTSAKPHASDPNR
jgi:cellobiose phosphorylase